jgi:hypothetical protein
MGCEARKIPADAEVFFLDFPFYRTYQAESIRGGTIVQQMQGRRHCPLLLVSNILGLDTVAMNGYFRGNNYAMDFNCRCLCGFGGCAF